MSKMNAEQIAAELALLSDWEKSEDEDAIEKFYSFSDFVTAMGWINAVAVIAERMNHHPDWTNSNNRVYVTLTTHSVGGLTQRDFEMAREMDALLGIGKPN